MAEELEGRVALVFGGGSARPGTTSNGQATAITFARAGAKVAVVDLSLEAAEETAHLIVQGGGDALPLAADVSSASQVEAAVALTMAAYRGIDVLHNNVGINELARFLDTSETLWDRVLGTNVKGMFLATKAAAPHMIAGGGGSIINVSALASIRYLGPAVTYMTAKAAVNGFTQSVAMELVDHGIRCNAILPGFIDTPAGLAVYEMGDPATRETRYAYRNSKLPGGKAGSPWDIAATALFLASDASRYLNGVLMPVDGGVRLYSPTAI